MCCLEIKRTFLAIKIPSELKKKIKEIQKEIENLGIDAKFVETENLHFNLKFFGSKTENEISKLKKIIHKEIKKFKKFEIEVKGMGAFPSSNFLRVIWIGIGKGKKELLEIHKNLENEFEKIGIKKENRGYKPHLTLCRLRSQDNQEKLQKKIKENENKNIGAFEVREITLIQSKLSPKGPVYVDLKKFELN